MEAFLKEMVSLTGQNSNNLDAAPVLELQFGDVRTFTTVLSKAEVPVLFITAFLPRDERLFYSELFLSNAALGMEKMQDTACMWHVDEGGYAMIRKVPLRLLHNEPSVFDAILDTADQAEQWYALLCARLTLPH